MTQKKFINQLVSIKYLDWDNSISGIVIDYNVDWTYMASNPVDFVIDGYVLLRHLNIEGFRRDEDEIFREKVIKKKIHKAFPELPLNNFERTLKIIDKENGLFQVQLRAEHESYVGKLKSCDRDSVTIHTLNAKGEWDGQEKFKTVDIRKIEMDSDYLNSLKLIAK